MDIECLFVTESNVYPFISPVLKSMSDCDLNDLNCFYWQTPYQFTDSQISCFSPPIPIENRKTDTMQFKLILRINGDYQFSCSLEKDCLIYYQKTQTPSILSLTPQNFYAGSEIQFRFKQRSVTRSLLSNIKIGRNTCSPTFDRFYTYQANPESYFNCFIGNAKPEKVSDFLFNHYTGLPAVFSSFYKKYLNPESFNFIENFNAISGLNDLKKFDNSVNIQNLFMTSEQNVFAAFASNVYPYAFRIFPYVAGISSNEITPAGKNVIKISGSGFIANKDFTKVFIDSQDNPCVISQITTEEIICETTKLNQNLLDKVAKYTNVKNSTDYKKPEFEKMNAAVFPGTPGLAYKLYIPNIKDEYFTQINNNYVKSDIFLETASKFNQEEFFSEYFTGYFKAPVTTDYKFYISSDDFAFVFLWINGVRTKVIDFRNWSEHQDFISNPYQISSWIRLIGGNVYYFEIVHHEFSSIDHMTLGVEIKNPKYLKAETRLLSESDKDLFKKLFLNKKDINEATSNLRKTDKIRGDFADYNSTLIDNPIKVNNKTSIRKLQTDENMTFTYANQVPLIQKISIKPKRIARELYEIILPGLNRTYDLICKNTNPLTNLEKPYNILTFNVIDSISTIRNQFAAFLNQKIVMKKISLSSSIEYIAGSDTDSTYSTLRPFSAFYNSKQINYLTSTQAGVSLLFFIDNSIDKKTYYNTDCTISQTEKKANTINYNVNLIQSVSNKLDGFFVLKITDEFNGVYKTDNIPCSTWDLIEYLNKIPYLSNKVQVLKSNIGLELIEFIIRLDLNSKSKFELDRHFIKGGVIDEIEITFEDLMPKTENLFFYPIPTEFLMKKNENPQLRVISNEIEAVCEDCSLKIILNLPLIIDFNYNPADKSIQIKLDKSLTTKENIKIKLGLEATSALYTEDLTTSSFILTAKFQKETGGIYLPEVTLPYGKLDFNAALIGTKSIEINFLINEISPKSIPYTGGTLMQIKGGNFPSMALLNGKTASEIGLFVSIGELPCQIQSFDFDLITCIAPKKNINDSLTLEYANKKIEENKSKNLLSWDHSVIYPSLVSVEPNNAAPGERKFIYINFDSSISNFNKNDLVVELKNKAKEKKYRLFVAEVLEDGKKLKAKYSGAPLGSYEISVKVNENTNFNSILNFDVYIKIFSVIPNEGSIEGGTLVTIKGENFLPQKLNQLVFIKNLICNYESVSKTEITCLTSPAPPESIDIPYTLVVDQLLQYESKCFDTKTNCLFKYSTEKTSMVNDIRLPDKSTNLHSLMVGSEINVYGEKLFYRSFPYTLSFDWGKLIVVSSQIDAENSLNLPSGNKTIILNCKVVEITKYITTYLDFYDSNGYSQLKNPRTDQGNFMVSFELAKPNLISFLPNNPIMKQGAMFEVQFDDIKGFFELSKFRNATSSLNICENFCTLFLENDNFNNPNNLYFNDYYESVASPLPVKSNILRCKFVNTAVNPFLNQSAFANCGFKIINYFNSIISNANLTNVNLLAVDKHIKVSTIKIDGIDFTNNLANIVNISKNIINFNIEFKLYANNIPKENQNIKLILNDNTIILSTNCQTINKIEFTITVYYLACSYDVNTSNISYGHYDVHFYLSNFGYLELPGIYAYKPNTPNTAISFKIFIPMQLNNDKVTVIKSSFNGGKQISIPILNLNEKLKQSARRILICGLPAKINRIDKTTGVSFDSLTILKSNLNFAKYILENQPIDLTFDESITLSSTPNTRSEILKLLDNNPYTFFSRLEKIGIGINKEIPADFKLYINYFVIYSTEFSNVYDLIESVLEASDNDIDFIPIMTLDKEFFTFNEKKIYVDYSNIGKKYFRTFRLSLKSALSVLSEIKFFGNIVFDNPTNENLDCTIAFKDAFSKITQLPLYTLNYRTQLSLEVTDVNPNLIIGLGEANTVNIALNAKSKLLSDLPNINVLVYGMLLDKKLISINWDPLTFYRISLNVTDFVPNTEVFDIKSALKINIEEIGNLAFNDKKFDIYYRWSDTRTWGMDFVPGFKDSVYIKNLNILFDVEKTELNFLLIENCSLKFEATRDYNIKANNILIRSGNLIIGTEAIPFNKKFELTFTSKKKDPTLPIFGNKVLAVMEGTLDIHGIKKEFTWTLLAKTANIGEDFILVQDPVDWARGDEIVIASSNAEPLEAERFTIKEIIYLNENSEENKNLKLFATTTTTSTSSSNQQNLNVFRKAKIILSSNLNFQHYGELESYTRSDGKSFTINTRSEVALLSRNIKIHGDEASTADLYGSHIMLTGKQDESALGRIEFAEIYNAGQAYQMGRYPIHFHMIGSVKGSYVRGCAIHDTYNRGLTIHGVHNFLVEKNVAYNNLGHAFFMEDAIETKNRVLGNLGILTKKSFSLLNSDTTPATFWITNPFNFYENNRAAGSQHYGFWMEFPQNPSGLSTKSRACPREYPLGSFKNNFSHSNLKYGLRIFPEFNPKSKPCATFSVLSNSNLNLPIEAVIEKFTTWRNKEKGVISEAVGNVVFKEIIAVDNSLSGIEVSNLLEFPGGRAAIKDSVVIGISLNPVKRLNSAFSTKGIVTPRADNFLISNITFFNFNADEMANFGSCSRCEISEPSTDSGARQIDFEKIFFDGSEKNKVIWNYPKRAIFRDLDGSLTGKSTAGWATPFYNHNYVKECEIADKFQNGLVCDDTVQVRRIAFSEAKPDVLKQKKIKIWRFNNDEIFDPQLINRFITPENQANYTAIDFKVNKDPVNGWAVPFVTGYDYAVSFDLGVNFDALKISRSVFWNSKDSPINLVFNFTARRDDFDSIISNKTHKNIFTSANSTNLFNKTLYNQKLLNNEIKFGDRFINKNKSLLMLHVNGKDFSKQFDYSLAAQLDFSLNAIQCFNNNCNPQPANIEPLEDRIRLWSDPSSWPNNTLPKENENVEIKSSWNMILDRSPPQINFLTVNGKLAFDNTKENLILKANRIFIYNGVLQIGNSTNPFVNEARILLTGKQIDPILALGNSIKFTNNILLNLNKLEINGLDRSPYKVKLRKPAKAGDTELFISANLKWKAGDEIILGTTTHDYNQTEKLRIKAYDAAAGRLTIDSNLTTNEFLFFNEKLKYDHYGSESETNIPESNLDKLNTYDERADVVMLTRNVKIGSEKESFWGANVYSTGINLDINNTLLAYPGEFVVKNAEFVNCGQNAEFPALILRSSAEKSRNEFKQNSFNYIKFAAVQISKIKNLVFDDVSVFSPMKFGVLVEDSENVTISNSIVFNLRLEETMVKAGFIDKGAGFYICVEGAVGCKNVVVKNNKNCGSEFMGFALKGFECDFNMENSFYNTATASRYGFIIDKSRNTSCMKAGKLIAYNNYAWGITAYPDSDSINFENVLSSNNLKGIGIFAGSKQTNTRKSLKKAYIIGQNPENPICIKESNCKSDEDPCIQMGFILSTTSLVGKTFPILLKKLPMNKVVGDAQFGSFFDISETNFFNFNQECEIESIAIHSNSKSIDTFSIHNFERIKFKNIFANNFIKLENTDAGSASSEKICGNFPCTGLKNIIIKFKDLIETENAAVQYLRSSLNNTMLSYKSASSENLNLISDANLIKSGTSIISIPEKNNFTNNKFCSGFKSSSNSLICASSLQPAHLIFENIEPEAETRAVHPVYVSSEEFEFTNKLNSFADHKCLFGYESLIRTPRFPSLILLNKDAVNKYNITFTSTNPNRIAMQLLDADWKNLNITTNTTSPPPTGEASSKSLYVVNIKIKYQSPQTVIVSKNKQEVKADIFTDSSNSNYLNMNYTNVKTLCGKNTWNTVENLLDVFITNEPDCILLFEVVNSVKLSLRYDIKVQDFYNANSHYSLMAKIASVLGIDISQVKIASIVKGSTVVNLDILEKPPAQIINEAITSNNNNTNNTNIPVPQNNTIIDANSTLARSLIEIKNSINNMIGEGSLGLGYELLSANVQLNTAKNDNKIIINNDETNNNNTNQNNNNTKPDSNNNNSTDNNNTKKNDTDSRSESDGKPNNDDKSNKIFAQTWYYLYCFFVFVVIVIVISCICCVIRSRGDSQENFNMLVQNESNVGISYVTERSNRVIELRDKSK